MAVETKFVLETLVSPMRYSLGDKNFIYKCVRNHFDLSKAYIRGFLEIAQNVVVDHFRSKNQKRRACSQLHNGCTKRQNKQRKPELECSSCACVTSLVPFGNLPNRQRYKNKIKKFNIKIEICTVLSYGP